MVDVARVTSESGDLGVVADPDDERVGRGAVAAGLEQQRIALGSHLVVDLLGVDRVDRRLDIALRHARVEHLYVRPEVRIPGRAGGRCLGDPEAGQRERDGESESNGDSAVRRHRRPAFRWRGRTAHDVMKRPGSDVTPASRPRPGSVRAQRPAAVRDRRHRTAIQMVFCSVYWSKRLESLVAAAEAGLLVAAERRADVALRVAVHRHRARLDGSGHPQGLVDVLGPDRGCQPVAGVVGQRDRLVLGSRRGSSRSPGRRSRRARWSCSSARRRRSVGSTK